MKHDVISVPESGAHIASLPGTIPPAPAVMAVLDRFNREQLGSAIEVLISLLDIWDGDPDVEDNNDQEASDGDDKDVAYGEWSTSHAATRDTLRITQNEDDEDDDPAEEDDPSGQCTEDEISSSGFHYLMTGPGCTISDTGIGDTGGLQDAHGVDWSGLQYGIDQTKPLCNGHVN